MNKRIVGLWVRIGVAAVSTLLAVQATTGQASANAQSVTVTSITRTGLTTIQVSGTATFSQGDNYAGVWGTLAQAVGRTIGNDGEGTGLGDVPVVTNAGDPYTFNWTLTFYNPYGWKAAPATLSITAESYDPSLGHGTQQTTSGRVNLPR